MFFLWYLYLALNICELNLSPGRNWTWVTPSSLYIRGSVSLVQVKCKGYSGINYFKIALRKISLVPLVWWACLTFIPTNNFKLGWRWPYSVVSLAPLSHTTNTHIDSILGRICLFHRLRCDFVGGSIKESKYCPENSLDASKLSQRNNGFVLTRK